MNRERRNRIKNSGTRLDTAIEIFNSYIEDLELIQLDEQLALENLPESFQYGERGDEMQEAIEDIGDAIDVINKIIDQLNETKANLSNL